MTVRRAVLAVLLVAATCGVYAALAAPAGPRSLKVFDPDRVADLEVGMWQAYYRKENVRLFLGLVTTLREQYRYSWAGAAVTAFYLARAAASFGNLRSDYESVLPDLEHAYRRIRDWTGGTFDPGAVSRAELAWWVARRIPAEADPGNVGRLIGQVNASIFAVAPESVLTASVLRARAGRLRDEGGDRADWAAVSELLHGSYRELHRAVNAPAAGL